jgi:hypothetical protein
MTVEAHRFLATQQTTFLCFRNTVCDSFDLVCSANAAQPVLFRDMLHRRVNTGQVIHRRACLAAQKIAKPAHRQLFGLATIKSGLILYKKQNKTNKQKIIKKTTNKQTNKNVHKKWKTQLFIQQEMNSFNCVI